MLIDTHVHTSPASICAHVPTEEAVRLYKEKGFGGFMLTNHFYLNHLERLADNYKDQKEAYLNEFFKARALGDEIGIKVFLGAEIRITEHETAEDGTIKEFRPEFITFGITPEILRNMPPLFSTDQKTLFEYANANGLLIYQAHPYRAAQGHHPANPNLMHGVEIYNGHPNFLTYIDESKAFADLNNNLYSSGCDMHVASQIGRAGMIVDNLIEDSVDLKEFLKNNRPKKLVPEKLLIEF